MTASRARTKSAPHPKSGLLDLFGTYSYIVIPVVAALVIFGLAVSSYRLPSMIQDAHAYTMAAQRLVRDGVYSLGGPLPGVPVPANARVTPGYILFLAAFYGLLGRTGDLITAIRNVHPLIVGVQFLFAIVGVGLIAAGGRELGGKRLGMVAGLFAACYLPFAWVTSVSLAESIALPLLAGQLLFALRLLRKNGTTRTPLSLFAFGVFSAVVVMVRPSMVLWIVVPLAYAAIMRLEPWPRLAKLALFAALGVVLVFAPWWIRNANVIGTFVPLRTDSLRVVPAGAGGAAASQPATAQPVQGALPIPTTQEQIKIAFGVAGTAWAAPDDVLWENNFRYTEARVDFGDFPLTTHDKLVPFMRAMGIYQVILWLLALASLVMLRSAPRIAVVFSVAPYTYLIHFTTQISPRYQYLGMPALVLAGAAGAYVLWHYGSRALHNSQAG